MAGLVPIGAKLRKSGGVPGYDEDDPRQLEAIAATNRIAR
jgi:hypothetical protein